MNFSFQVFTSIIIASSYFAFWSIFVYQKRSYKTRFSCPGHVIKKKNKELIASTTLFKERKHFLLILKITIHNLRMRPCMTLLLAYQSELNLCRLMYTHLLHWEPTIILHSLQDSNMPLKLVRAKIQRWAVNLDFLLQERCEKGSLSSCNIHLLGYAWLASFKDNRVSWFTWFCACLDLVCTAIVSLCKRLNNIVKEEAANALRFQCAAH